MQPDRLTIHTLIRVASAEALVAGPLGLPGWVYQAVVRAPWVVIRRAPARDGLVAVGVRGVSRRERFASWLPVESILECVTPEEIGASLAWRRSSCRADIPAFGILDQVQAIMRRHGLEGAWGPTGSVGFELSSGYPAATSDSDVDLAVRLEQLPSKALACSLDRELSELSVLTDTLLELPQGAVVLAEYARSQCPFVLRTMGGPRLIKTPGESVSLFSI